MLNCGRICSTLSSTSNIHHQFFFLFCVEIWGHGSFVLTCFHNSIFYLKLWKQSGLFSPVFIYGAWKTILSVWIWLRYLKICLCVMSLIPTYEEDFFLFPFDPRREDRPIYHINEEDKPTLVRPVNEYKVKTFHVWNPTPIMQKQDNRWKNPTSMSDEVITWCGICVLGEQLLKFSNQLQYIEYIFLLTRKKNIYMSIFVNIYFALLKH